MPFSRSEHVYASPDFEEMIKELNQNLAKRLKDCPEISKDVEKISSKKKVSHSRQDEITHEPEIE